MISSQDGTDARRERPPAAFLTGRCRAGACCAAAAGALSCSAAGPAGAGTRAGPGWARPSGPAASWLSRLPMGVTVAAPSVRARAGGRLASGRHRPAR